MIAGGLPAYCQLGDCVLQTTSTTSSTSTRTTSSTFTYATTNTTATTPLLLAAVFPATSSGNTAGDTAIITVFVVIAAFIIVLMLIFTYIKRKRQSRKPVSVATWKAPSVITDDISTEIVANTGVDANIAVSGVFSGPRMMARMLPETPTLDENLMEQAILPQNKAKNRYADILPYDSTRVKLRSREEDYINANYVPGYHSNTEYILTQAPLPATADDFWTMVWENDTHVIVMITLLSENGREKSHQYWPNAIGDTMQVKDLTITMTREYEERDQYVHRMFYLLYGVQERTVHHFQFLPWPDHGVPSSTPAFIDFRGKIREAVLDTGDAGPIVVHCSAGVGRTGCFVTIDIQLEKFIQENIIDIYTALAIVRQFRCKLIQTSDQYVFVHQAVVDSIANQKEISQESVCQLYEIPNPYTEDGIEQLQDEFFMLPMVCKKDENYNWRFDVILPMSPSMDRPLSKYDAPFAARPVPFQFNPSAFPTNTPSAYPDDNIKSFTGYNVRNSIDDSFLALQSVDSMSDLHSAVELQRITAWDTIQEEDEAQAEDAPSANDADALLPPSSPAHPATPVVAKTTPKTKTPSPQKQTPKATTPTPRKLAPDEELFTYIDGRGVERTIPVQKGTRTPKVPPVGKLLSSKKGHYDVSNAVSPIEKIRSKRSPQQFVEPDEVRFEPDFTPKPSSRWWGAAQPVVRSASISAYPVFALSTDATWNPELYNDDEDFRQIMDDPSVVLRANADLQQALNDDLDSGYILVAPKSPQYSSTTHNDSIQNPKKPIQPSTSNTSGVKVESISKPAPKRPSTSSILGTSQKYTITAKPESSSAVPEPKLPRSSLNIVPLKPASTSKLEQSFQAEDYPLPGLSAVVAPVPAPLATVTVETLDDATTQSSQASGRPPPRKIFNISSAPNAAPVISIVRRAKPAITFDQPAVDDEHMTAMTAVPGTAHPSRALSKPSSPKKSFAMVEPALPTFVKRARPPVDDRSGGTVVVNETCTFLGNCTCRKCKPDTSA